MVFLFIVDIVRNLPFRSYLLSFSNIIDQKAILTRSLLPVVRCVLARYINLTKKVPGSHQGLCLLGNRFFLFHLIFLFRRAGSTIIPEHHRIIKYTD